MADYITFQPSDYFNTLLYTGTGSSNAVTGVGFRPDFVWIKGRDFSDNHNLYDIVRGVEKRIVSNTNGAEEDRPAGLTAFGSDGFTVNTANGENKSSAPICSWNWRAGNSQGSSNTDGTINTTYTSANTTSGFSICKWTGTGSAGTIGHGLGAVPKMIIMKKLSSNVGWVVYHHSDGANKYLRLNTTDAEATDTNMFNNTTPTSSLFSLGTDSDNNGSGATYIAYCFAEKKGFSKFGKYRGNGNATDAPFVYTGFKPQFVLWKRADSAGAWIMMDSKRSSTNVMDDLFEANTSGAEAQSSSYETDFLSNGFKIRNTNNVFNNSSGTYVYMAFADQPLVSSNNVPATAR